MHVRLQFTFIVEHWEGVESVSRPSRVFLNRMDAGRQEIDDFMAYAKKEHGEALRWIDFVRYQSRDYEIEGPYDVMERFYPPE